MEQENTRDGVAVSALAGVGLLFDSFVINVYGLLLPFIALTFHAKPVTLGFVASLFLIGFTIGTMGFGILADYLGRKGTMSISIAAYAVITTLTSLSNSVGMLGIMRFLTGMGGGGEQPVGAVFTAEMWPAKRRGWGVGLFFVGYPFGYLLAIGLTAGVVPLIGWRGVFAVAIIPGFLIWFLRSKLKESPRFEAVRRRLEAQGSKQRVGMGELMKHRQSRRNLLVGSLVFLPLAYTYFALQIFLPTYMETNLHLPYSQVLTDLTLVTLCEVLLVLLMGWLVDIVGRRPLAVIYALICCIGGLFMFNTTSPGVFLAIAFIVYPTWTGLAWELGNTYVPEIFPTAVRGTGFGLSVGFGRIISILAPVLSGFLASSIGFAGAFKVAAVVWVIYIVGFLLGRETRGKTLEEIQQVEMVSPSALDA